MNIMVVFIAVILVMVIEYLFVKKKNSRDEEDHDNYGNNYHDEYPFHSNGDTNVIKQTLSDLGYDQPESAGAEYDE